MSDFEELAAQTSACATRWEDARQRYSSATTDWATSLRAMADHLEGGELDRFAATLREFATSLDESASDSALPELKVRELVGPSVSRP